MPNKCIIKRMISELNPDCAENKYCFYKMWFECAALDIRTVEQLKCIEKFKWEINEQSQEEFSWEFVVQEWIRVGHAAKFSEIYDEDLSIKELYEKTTGKKQK